MFRPKRFSIFARDGSRWDSSKHLSDVPNRIAVSLNSMGRLKLNWLPVVVVLHQEVEASGR